MALVVAGQHPDLRPYSETMREPFGANARTIRIVLISLRLADRGDLHQRHRHSLTDTPARYVGSEILQPHRRT
jgi:hypothetical protein